MDQEENISQDSNQDTNQSNDNQVINNDNAVSPDTGDNQSNDDDYHPAVDFDYEDGEFDLKELDEDVAFQFLKKSRGLEVDKIDDLLKPREVNPYEDVLDDDDKAYLNYKKETKRSRADYEKINADLTKIPKIDLARERVRKESGEDYSNDQIDAYLADTLGIDLEDMTSSDEIKLASFTKAILEEKRVEQEKYKKPADKAGEALQGEYVKLDNGAVMLKKDYEKLELEQSNSEKSRLAKIEIAKQAVNSVMASNFEIEIGENGNVVKENYTYDYSETDKQSMLSNVSNLDGEITKDYTTDNGFDYKQFGEDMFWRNKNNRERAISSIIHKALARNTEEVLKQRGNVNFTSNDNLQQQSREGVKVVPITNIFNK